MPASGRLRRPPIDFRQSYRHSRLRCEVRSNLAARGRFPFFWRTSMAWYSYTLASTVPLALIAEAQHARKLLQTEDRTHFVFTASRHGVLLETLSRILACSSIENDLYLLKDQAVLTGNEIQRQAAGIDALLSEIDRNPQLVIEATKGRHETTGTVHLDGFQPLPHKIIYPENVTIKDDWVYYYSQEEVRALVASAPCMSDPKPETDDEGESLEYVFGFLKSHASLLRVASDSGLGVAYAEMNPAS